MNKIDKFNRKQGYWEEKIGDTLIKKGYYLNHSRVGTWEIINLWSNLMRYSSFLDGYEISRKIINLDLYRHPINSIFITIDRDENMKVNSYITRHIEEY